MVRSRKSTALKEAELERALKAENVVDMRFFFKYLNDPSDYWISGMILGISNASKEQKIRLARKVIKDEGALNFFFKKIYEMDDV